MGYSKAMSNTTIQSATERADALLTRWGQRLSRTGGQTPPVTTEAGGAVQRAETLLDGAKPKISEKISGRGFLEATARVYVALAAKTGEVVTPVAQTWQESVDKARREQEQKAAQNPSKPSAGQEGADEKEGEHALTETAGAATEAAGTAAGA